MAYVLTIVEVSLRTAKSAAKSGAFLQVPSTTPVKPYGMASAQQIVPSSLPPNAYPSWPFAETASGAVAATTIRSDE